MNTQATIQKTKKKLWGLLAIVFMVLSLGACQEQHTYDPLEGEETTTITDDCGRKVTIPARITRIAPSGATAQMVLLPIGSDNLVGLSSSPSLAQMAYFPEEIWSLPTFGQFYGKKANLNMEALIDAQPQLIIDIGDKKTTIKSDMDSIQKQTGIPTIYLNGALPHLADTYRILGKLLDKEEKAEELAAFIEKTLSMAEENREKITEEETLSVYFGTGASSLACNAGGSSQAEVIDVIGAKNAIIVPANEITDRGGGTLINLEELYTANPDILILDPGGQYEGIKENEWSRLPAVKSDRFYEIPSLPYSWMASPPSVNKVLGVWWLGGLVYPQYYTHDMTEIAREYYRIFWNYELSPEEAAELLKRSYGK